MKKSLYKRQYAGRRTSFKKTESNTATNPPQRSQPRLSRTKTLNIDWHDPVDWAVIGAGLALLILLSVFLYHFSHDVSAILLTQKL